jgi:hypothetical protein
MRQTSDQWIGYITNFATTGDPNKGPTTNVALEKGKQQDLRTWNAFSNAQGPYIRLDAKVQQISSPRTDYCRALVSPKYKQR